MKNFKDLLSEVAQPKSAEEQRFKDLHKVELIKHPVAPEYVHTGEVEGLTKKARPADQSGDDNYDQAYAVKDKPFKMPRNIDEEAEQIEEAKVGDECSCCGGKIDEDGKCGCGPDCKHCGGQHDISESTGITFKSLLEKVVEEDIEDFDDEDLISEEPEYVSEEPQQEIPMMMRQLHFIGYAADEIMEYLATADDPEEWYQNKLANAFSMMKTLHAYVEGDKRMDPKGDLEAGYMMSSYYGEEAGEHDSPEFEKEIEMLSKMIKDGEHNRVASMIKRTKALKGGGGWNLTRKPSKKQKARYNSMISNHRRSHPELYGEEVVREELEEANFKAGSMKLKDGTQVKISMDDARAITAVMKTLNPKNRKEMESRMMKDKKGFEEILDFAREAQ